MFFAIWETYPGNSYGTRTWPVHFPVFGTPYKANCIHCISSFWVHNIASGCHNAPCHKSLWIHRPGVGHRKSRQSLRAAHTHCAHPTSTLMPPLIDTATSIETFFFSLYRLVERVEVDDMMHFNMVTTEMPIKSQVPMLSIFRCCVFVQRDSTRQTFLTVNIAIVSLVSFLVQFRRQEHLSLSNLFDYTVFGKKWGSAERSSLTPPVKELSIVVPEYICTIGIAISLHFTVGDKRLQCHSIIRWNCGCNADKTNIHKCTPRILDTFCVLLGFVVDECLHPSMVLNVSKSTLINMGPWIHCELIIQPQQSRAQQNRAHKSCGICYTSFF